MEAPAPSTATTTTTLTSHPTTTLQESWTSSDMVDCILSYTATALVEALLTPGGGNGSAAMLDALRADPRASAQLLVLALAGASATASCALALLLQQHRLLWLLLPERGRLLQHLLAAPGQLTRCLPG